jgi:elongation factor P
MKTAQEFRIGNVLMLDANSPMLVIRNEYTKGGRNAATSKLKLRNVLTGQNTEVAVKASDKFEQVVLDQKEVQFLYKNGEIYAFMDQESYETLELHESEIAEEFRRWLEESMMLSLTYYGEKPVGIDLPNYVERVIEYSEPGARGDTSGKVLKPATIKGGVTVMVPLFCEIGTCIRIDTRTGEYMERVNR